jgi:tetratricopeptide (TPR) repeat protein
MLESQLNHARLLRDNGRAQEAVDFLSQAASACRNIVNRIVINLEIIDMLIAQAEYSSARQTLFALRQLQHLAEDSTLTTDDKQELEVLAFRIELEGAEINAAEGKLSDAREKMTALLEKYAGYSRSITLRPEFDNLRSQLAFVLVNQGEFHLALQILDDVASRYPNNSAVILYLGHCYFGLKQFVPARDMFQKALRLGLPSHLEFQAHCRLGKSHYELGEYMEAKMELEKGAETASQEYIEHSHLWKWLEYTCIKLGFRDDALRYRQMAHPC